MPINPVMHPSSRDGSLQAERPKRSFTPTSDDGDLVVTPVGEHIDDTPPPEGQPVIRQAVAFKTAATQVQTYQATLPAKQPSCFLPGQAPVAVPPPPSTPTSVPIIPVSAPTPLSLPVPVPLVPATASTHTQTNQPQFSSQRFPSSTKASTRKTSSSRRKKAEGKARHFNDQFSTQTGRFKVSSEPVHDPTAVQRTAPTTYGSGPYSSMYRMVTDSPGTITTSVAGSVSPAPSLPSSGRSSGGNYSSAGPSRSTASLSYATSPAQPRASGSKSSTSGRRDSTRQNTVHQQPVQPSQTSGSQYYRRDYDRDSSMYGSSSNGNTHRHLSPRETTSQSVSATTQRTNPGDNNASSSRQSAHVDPQSIEPLRMLTVLIEDIRSGVTDHQLAEVRVPLFKRQDCLWANSQEVCEQLQASASRIYGPARVYTLRGKYRQFFLRVSGDNVDEITPSNLKISSDRTLDIVVEAPPQQGVLPQPPQIPREVLSPSPESDTSVPIDVHSLHGISSQEALKQLNRLVPMKRQRPESPLGAPHRQQFAHISPHNSPPPSRTPSLPPPKKPKRGAQCSSSDYSQMSPRSAQYYQKYARNYNIPLPTAPNTPGRAGSTQEEIDAAIVRFIKPLIEEDPQWMKYMESKAKPQRVSEVLKQYDFVQGKVDELDDVRTPIHWDGAPNFEVEKHHVWQTLNLETPWGPDCQETLSLLALYGPNGHHYEDSRVVDMMNDTAVPTGKPYKRFLKLLRQIDQDWLKDHLDDAESNDSLGSMCSGEAGDEMDFRNGS